MPIILVYTFEGKTAQQKEDWIEGITRVSLEVTGLTDPSICTVIINEVPKQNWGKSGLPVSELEQGTPNS